MLSRLNIYSCLCVGALLILSGCDTMRSTFGLDHYQADAFDVPTNPPLILPPDYNLRPPTPGVQPTYAVKSSDMVQNTLGLQPSRDASSHHVLSTVHASHTPPENIREVINREADEESTIPGKIGEQVKDWKGEAKKNLGSIFEENPKKPV